LPGWDDVCGGGLWWSHDRTYKNAITTELFLLAAARLARHCPDQGYDEWADRAATWFDHSGLINVDGLVNDGLDRCANNGGPTWTYNQGVLLGGLAERWRATEEPRLLDRAHTVARATISRLVDADGILREPCEVTGTCDRDQLIFKGIFAAGLARLWSVDPDPAYVTFLVGNADSVWQRARDRRDGLALSWRGPAGPVTAASHASGTLLLGAALAVQ